MTVKYWTIEKATGYRPQTTFYSDFSIADRYWGECNQVQIRKDFGLEKECDFYDGACDGSELEDMGTL